jgi:hypothetical protein
MPIDDPSSSKSTPKKTTRSISRPLRRNPELEIIVTRLSNGEVTEYRVHNFRTLKSGRRVRGDGWSLIEIALLVLILLLWTRLIDIPKTGRMMTGLEVRTFVYTLTTDPLGLALHLLILVDIFEGTNRPIWQVVMVAS